VNTMEQILKSFFEGEFMKENSKNE